MCFSEVAKGTKFCFHTRKGKCERVWNDAAACDASLILKMFLNGFFDDRCLSNFDINKFFKYEMSKKGFIGFSYKILFRSRDN